MLSIYTVLPLLMMKLVYRRFTSRIQKRFRTKKRGHTENISLQTNRLKHRDRGIDFSHVSLHKVSCIRNVFFVGDAFVALRRIRDASGGRVDCYARQIGRSPWEDGVSVEELRTTVGEGVLELEPHACSFCQIPLQRAQEYIDVLGISVP